jgi:hypothetical protein
VTLMAVAGLALLVGADLRHRCLVGRRVAADRDLRCHAAHRMDPTAPGNLLLQASLARFFIDEKLAQDSAMAGDDRIVRSD